MLLARSSEATPTSVSRLALVLFAYCLELRYQLVDLGLRLRLVGRNGQLNSWSSSLLLLGETLEASRRAEARRGFGGWAVCGLTVLAVVAVPAAFRDGNCDRCLRRLRLIDSNRQVSPAGEEQEEPEDLHRRNRWAAD